MERTIKIITAILIWLSLSACYESPHIDFHSFQELSEYNFIRNGWIPEVVGTDAYNIQETYDVGNHHVFGKFDFKYRSTYDSIIQSYDRVEKDSLLGRIEKIHKPRYQKWFIPKTDLAGGNYVITKHDNFYLILDTKINRIYYLR